MNNLVRASLHDLSIDSCMLSVGRNQRTKLDKVKNPYASCILSFETKVDRCF